MKVKVSQLCPTVCNPTDCSPWNSPGQNTGVGSCFHLQGVFLTQGSKPGLPHCRRILYQLSHQGKNTYKRRSRLGYIPILFLKKVKYYQASEITFPYQRLGIWALSGKGKYCFMNHLQRTWSTKLHLALLA